ncbi:hypothetical protein EX30DRAFT_394710 [Ascodesmis nigricans]|uniref:Flavin reductase like domain-containing protein n=1 Tax=Ascodesmis nigricans TaxID=341454 RepID=A0A4S2MZZ1_9PEZI|nr:hypothetical protein EX30DRAFT_394710 [Ascodesmis nigricans]
MSRPLLLLRRPIRLRPPHKSLRLLLPCPYTSSAVSKPPLTPPATSPPPTASSQTSSTAVSPPSESPDAVSTALRHTMRILSHPVVILTAPPDRGITLSSLTCLSLHPHPLVSFNIKKPSSCSEAMHDSGVFAVHIMKSTGHAAHLANIFAQVGMARGKKRRPWDEVLDLESVATWGDPQRLQNEDSGKGWLVIGKGDGVDTRLWCGKEKVLEVGDHEIWVARVLEVEKVADLAEGEGAGMASLMYVDRRFHHVGEEVVPEHGSLGQEVDVGAPEDE